MSSDLSVFENYFFSDSFSSFIDSPIDHHDIFQSISENTFDNNSAQQNPLDETNYIDQISLNFLSSSPPSHQLGNLSISQTTHLENGYAADFSALEIKTEECQIPMEESFDGYYSNLFVPHSYGGSSSSSAAAAAETAVKLMQRSYSSNSFDGKPSFLFQPQFDSLLESPNFQAQVFSSPTGQMRRVCSTGDLQKMMKTTTQMLSSSPLATERSFMEEANFKVGRYSSEERKERIHRYRAKRNQRNFNKTIKYACRKTLADNRPRIRGRFARNDEAVESSKTATFIRYEDEDDIWIDGFQEEDDERTVGGGAFFKSYALPQFQFYGYT